MNFQPCYFFCGYNMPITTVPFSSVPHSYCLPFSNSHPSD